MKTNEIICVALCALSLFVSAVTMVNVNNKISEKKQLEKVEIKEVEFQTIKLDARSMSENKYCLKVITKGKDGKNYSFILEGSEDKK